MCLSDFITVTHTITSQCCWLSLQFTAQYKKLSYRRETVRQLRISWLTDGAVHWTTQMLYNYMRSRWSFL